MQRYGNEVDTSTCSGTKLKIVRRSFPEATLVIDRFRVQKLVLDALQEIRIKHRWEVLDAKNDAIEKARDKSTKYTPELLPNEDTLKQ